MTLREITKPQFSPYAGRTFPTSFSLFGDTHLHTAISVDAGTMNRLGQEDAFPLCARRGGHLNTWGAARQAFASPRFPSDF